MDLFDDCLILISRKLPEKGQVVTSWKQTGFDPVPWAMPSTACTLIDNSCLWTSHLTGKKGFLFCLFAFNNFLMKQTECSIHMREIPWSYSGSLY